MKQLPLPIGIDATQTFENFLPGENAGVIAHLSALLPHAAPVYLWGPAGSGKSHLLRAAVHGALQRGGRAGWFSATTPAPWLREAGETLIVIDDCDALDSDRQQAAFALFVDAADQGTPILAAGHVPPIDLALREDLRTRLGWGHVFALQPLSEPEVRAALRRESDRRGTVLSDDVMDYLLTRFARDLKHLMAQLDRLDEFSLAAKRVITVPLLKRMLAEESAA